MPSLPYRFSEKSFRRYEHIIKRIVSDYPKPVVVNPSHLRLAAETVRGRLRDACSSFKTNGWQSDINYAAFVNLEPTLIISLRPDGTVIAGTKDSLSTPVEPIDAVVASEIVDMTAHNNYACHQILCLLAHNQALKKRIRVKLIPAEVAEMQNSFDIVLEQQLDGTYLLS